MLPPPLQLERSVVGRLLVESNDSYIPGSPQTPRGRWGLKLQQSNDQPDRWRVELDLRFTPEEDYPGPYRIELLIVGFFRLPDGLDSHEAARLVGITGASILYSAAREQVLLITGRGMWGAFQLPTIRFPPPAESTFAQGHQDKVDDRKGRDASRRTAKSVKRPKAKR